MKKILSNQKGQTLVILLVYMVIAVIITSAAIILVLNSSAGTGKVQQGISAFEIAESGAENAILKLIRDRNYSGETVNIGDGQAVVTVTGTNPKTILSVGTLNNFSRTIQVIVDTTGNTVTVTSWKEL